MSANKTIQEWLADYEDYREAFGYKKLHADPIHLFIKWCEYHHSDSQYLTQDIIDTWSPKRDTESDASYCNRASAINGFLRYINERGGGPIALIEYELSKDSPEPTLFTEDQLKNFFKAVDEYAPCEYAISERVRTCAKLNAIQLPVLFRLLYSTGMRVNEARWLHRDDVDLERGLIYIRRSKGYIERLIALHPSMTKLLYRYDAIMRKLMPDAVPFFPSDKEDYHHSIWLSKHFKMFWYKYNPKPLPGEKPVVAYALRHNYAVENIMNWHQDGYNADKRLIALNRSMGHVYIHSTQYYFHLVPKFADVMEELEGGFVNSIIPDVDL